MEREFKRSDAYKKNQNAREKNQNANSRDRTHTDEKKKSEREIPEIGHISQEIINPWIGNLET